MTMLHLNAERLAALADDEPTAEEALHISECFECARERLPIERFSGLPDGKPRP